jgi:hypothetical protein
MVERHNILHKFFSRSFSVRSGAVQGLTGQVALPLLPPLCGAAKELLHLPGKDSIAWQVSYMPGETFARRCTFDGMHEKI